MTKTTVICRIFSGRPDPEWTIDESILDEMEQLWAALTPADSELRIPSKLGYRGFQIYRNGDEKWLVYGEMVMRTVRKQLEVRIDSDKSLEKMLLSTAPGGLDLDKLIEEETDKD